MNFQQQIAYLFETVLKEFDYTILGFFHDMAEAASTVLTPFFRFISLLGELGIGLIVLAVVLLFFRKTRKMGITMIAAILIGALLTNVLLKDFVARPRPYTEVGSDIYQWWLYVGAIEVPEFSFPSGHATASMAGVLAFYLCSDKKRYAWIAFVYVVLMCMSRCYLMVHYPSDIIGGIIVGAIAGSLAYAIVSGIYRQHRKRKRKACGESMQEASPQAQTSSPNEISLR